MASKHTSLSPDDVRQILSALGIDPSRDGGHIRCPYPDHDDKRPSWRFDFEKLAAVCTCGDGGYHNIWEVASRRMGGDDEGKRFIASVLNPTRPKRDPFNIPTERRDEALVKAYLAHRLGVDDPLLPSTRHVGDRAADYYDGGKKVGTYPCALFEAGTGWGTRIYLAEGGAGKADVEPNKKMLRGRAPVGATVEFGEAATVYVTEGIETAAAIAYVLGPDAAVAATLSTSGLKNWKPRDGVEKVIIAADNDEAGIKAAEALAGIIGLPVAIALPEKDGEDFLDMFRRAGADAVRAVLEAAEPTLREPEPASPELAELNTKHALVMEEGKAVIVNFEHDPVFKRSKLTRSSVADFRTRYANRRIEVGVTAKREPKFMPLGNWWLEHPDRRQYDGVVFAPGQDVPGQMNLWSGFAVEPEPGVWSKFRCHIEEVICGGDADLYRYLMGWMALTVQRPGEPIEIAVVMRGGRGTGKGVFARTFGELFGRHFVHIAHARHLVGNFNAHLEDAVAVFADEAFWAGDKAGESALKTIITEPYIEIEAKYANARSAKNVVHLIMASNEDWAVPADLDERRFLVLDVADGHARDHDWFRAIRDEMDDAGKAAMLHDLMAMDLDGFNVRDVPNTAGLVEQKMLTMKPEEKWWHGKLYDGQLLPDDDGWRTEVRRDHLHDDYVVATGKTGVGRRRTETELGMAMNKRLVPSLSEVRRLDLKEWTDPDGTERSKEIRVRCWVLPSLEECRAHFDRLTHHKHEWPEVEDDDDGGCSDDAIPM